MSSMAFMFVLDYFPTPTRIMHEIQLHLQGLQQLQHQSNLHPDQQKRQQQPNTAIAAAVGMITTSPTAQTQLPTTNVSTDTSTATTNSPNTTTAKIAPPRPPRGNKKVVIQAQRVI